MSETLLRVQMLGDFSLDWGGRTVSITNRSRKLSLLLAILLLERPRPVACLQLAQQLWKEDLPPASFSPLKALIHRARTLLDQLWEGAGQALIISQNGSYQWSEKLSAVTDLETFQQLCRKIKNAPEKPFPLSLARQALALYQGDFLPGLGNHPWAASRRETLRQQYLQLAVQVLPALAETRQWQEILQITAVGDTEDQTLCRWQMEALLRLGRRQQSIRLYEALYQQTLSQRGVLPSPELRALYREARRDQDPQSVTAVTLLEQLRETEDSGAFFCEFDFFQAICRIISRMSQRTGAPLHCALLSLTAADGRTLAPFILSRAMNHLQEILLARLRRGDAFTRCSAFQFALLLPQASYTNGQLVCRRITRTFIRQYPHSHVLIQTAVFPLTAKS